MQTAAVEQDILQKLTENKQNATGTLTDPFTSLKYGLQ